ncbi:MAG TPA: alpha/beta fold hydrolase [Vicinamibacterales bacterium]|nr:alpha/beta fold hydrolase [Vicinamibacterales bacterium]
MMRLGVLVGFVFGGACAALVASPSLASQRVSIRTEDGLALAGTWHEPSRRPAPAVVLVHMLQRSRRDWEPLASRLASEGVGALTFDLRGHGESPGASPQDLATLVGDVRAARRFLVGRTDVIPGRVGLAGASLGATLAAMLAAEEPAIVALALLSPSLDYRGVRLEPAMRKLGSRALLLVAGDDDSYATRTVKDLQKLTGGRAEAHILPGAGHGTGMLTRDPTLSGTLVDWFRRALL